ncbi:hypothetical protein IEQ34_020413 [Dendrobium chrysotoxum]|uniref:Uncharacterized protein n=1 Tax=Dendrobium chrysotoxum TaxID=161865 RepID=A0AAV7G0V6_DENCH|nr:hypothetical protein IEQ34_020413 [Dendrobium chrysotoxum]
MRPIHPRKTPIRIQLAKAHAHHSGQIMLVDVAGRVAKAPEDGEEAVVGDDLDGELAAELEPLGAFAPARGGDGWEHMGVVAAAAVGSGIVVGFDEGGGGVEEVGVDGGEVEERDAGFGEEDESFVGEVEEGVCEETAFCFHHVQCSPFHHLHMAHGTLVN